MYNKKVIMDLYIKYMYLSLYSNFVNVYLLLGFTLKASPLEKIY